jgi:hypothetical protein
MKPRHTNLVALFPVVSTISDDFGTQRSHFLYLSYANFELHLKKEERVWVLFNSDYHPIQIEPRTFTLLYES